LLFARNPRQLNQLIKIVELFTTNTGIKFGVDKCQTLNIKRVEVVLGFETEGEVREPMDETGTHKYHGIIQSRQSEHTMIKKKLTTAWPPSCRNHSKLI
jgi:hypothetical protein